MKKGIWILLFSLLVCTFFQGCGNKSKTNQPIGTESQDTKETDYLDSLSWERHPVNSITIATIDSNMTLDVQPENISRVDEKKYERDAYLTEKYGVDINYHEIQNGIDSEEVVYMKSLFNSGDNSIDIFIQQPDNLMALALEGKNANLLSVQSLGLDNIWWSQTLNQNLEINNSLFIAAGAVAEHYYGAVMAMAYNKGMEQQLKMPDIQEMVLDNTWTLDEMNKLCVDYNLTNEETGKRAIAFSSGVGPYGLFASANGHFSTIDPDKGIVVNLIDTRSIDILTKITTVFAQDRRIDGNIYVSSDAFLSEKTFFYYTTVGYMQLFLPSSSVDYAIIPCPKYDAEQDQYYSCAWPSSSFATCIPSYITGDRLEEVGVFLEAYCYLGYQMIKPVKYDTILKYHVAADQISSNLLDLIFNNLYFDFNLVANFGGSRGLIGTTVLQGMGGYTGSYMGILNLINKDIATYNVLTESNS